MRKTLMAEIRVKGFWDIGGKRYPNRFNRNWGRLLEAVTRRANVGVYDESGASQTANTSYGSLLLNESSFSSSIHNYGEPYYVGVGLGTTAPLITDFELANKLYDAPVSLKWLDELSDRTRFRYAFRHSPHTSLAWTEAGLKVIIRSYDNKVSLLSRAVFAELTVPAFSDRLDAVMFEYPAGVTRNFLRALLCAGIGNYRRTAQGLPCVAQDGTNFVLRTADVFKGTNDLRTGHSNLAPSPAHYALTDDYASCEAQSQAVEEDEVLNEVRVVRTGTRTPPTDETLGEIGWFTTVMDRGGTVRNIMLARAVWTPAVTLSAGVVYTLGLVLRF